MAVVIASRLHAYLVSHGIAHDVLADDAERRRWMARAEGATLVACWPLAIGERYALLVLSADESPATESLNRHHDGTRVRLASETEIEHLFPDCDVDAIPPCGDPYGLPVRVSDKLASATSFICPAGRRGAWLGLDRVGFEQLAQPRWVTLPPVGGEVRIL